MTQEKIADIVHIGRIFSEGLENYLFLKRCPSKQFQWVRQEDPISQEFESLDRAFEFGWKEWKDNRFSPLACGYRFTLPERDEHGTPALFEEMAKSLNSMNGVFFHESLGHNCIVNQIPIKARRLYETIKSC